MEVRDKNIVIGRGKDLLFDVAQGLVWEGGLRKERGRVFDRKTL